MKTKISVYIEPDTLDWLKLKALEVAYETKDLKLGNVSCIVETAIEEYLIKDTKMKLRADKEESRKKEAIERQKMHDLLSPEQKLAKLDAKLGMGIGAKKERANLNKNSKTKKKDKKTQAVNE